MQTPGLHVLQRWIGVRDLAEVHLEDTALQRVQKSYGRFKADKSMLAAGYLHETVN